MSKTIKVSKKDERLARSLLWNMLVDNGYPEEKTDERVNEAWPGLLKRAKDINLGIRLTIGDELDGKTTESEIENWTT